MPDQRPTTGAFRARSLIFLTSLAISTTAVGRTLPDDEPAPRIVLRLPPSAGNPRNSEGDFVQRKDGSILFIYSHFYSGAGDNAGARLVSRISHDEGRSWSTKDEPVVDNEGKMNVMSVSLLRLQDGNIAIFYLRKNSERDCRPFFRLSSDEGRHWSKSHACILDQVGYFVMNNDRVVQLAGGRLILPLSLHWGEQDTQVDWNGRALCYLSDDNGKSWRRSKSVLVAMDRLGKRVYAQEPGVVQLADGRLMMFVRSNENHQLVSYSRDNGDTWSELRASGILSPVSPATIERIPGSGRLLMVWNDQKDLPTALLGRRTPLTVALSRDHGNKWINRKTLYDNPNGWYCYTAMLFVDDYVLLGHCAGDRTRNNGLAETVITRFPLAWVTGTQD